ncbi:hypothetical protein COU61_02515 [Candidatus Pacearchaeota archaeon CG10_big_fil_rev_8_21_14_0_10_35_13]|nr:MAG: hypothetical protein COU61_02515 [Candidatus Pacearchaeota archaeon CG10_big_fil_rev_8_21_14_0_10_35_13]
MVNKKPKKPRTKKEKIINFVAWTALAGATLGVGTWHGIKGSKHRGTYGTVSNPTFVTNIPFPQEKEVSTYKWKVTALAEKEVELLTLKGEYLERILTATEVAERRIKELEEYFEDNKKSEEELRAIAERDEEMFFSEAYRKNPGYVGRCSVLGDLDSRLSSLSLELIIKDSEKSKSDLEKTRMDMDELILSSLLANKTRSEEEKNYGDVKTFSKTLVEKMLGKNLPKGIEISITDLDEENLIGLANSHNRKIRTEDGSYARTSLIMVHEIAHLLSQHSEGQYYGSIHPSLFVLESRRETTIMEEAVSYALQMATPSFVGDTNLGKVMRASINIHSKEFIEEYFEGNKEEHREAMAIADVAVTYYKNPLVAYNYLMRTSYEELGPEILGVIKENKGAYEERKKLSEQLERKFDNARKKVGELSNTSGRLMKEKHYMKFEIEEAVRKAEEEMNK